MIITVELENYAIKNVLIDQGTSVDILYWTIYQKLQLPTTALVPYDEPTYNFSGEKVSTRNYIDLHIVFRDVTQTKTISIRFVVVDAPTSCNVLLGQPCLNTLRAVVLHLIWPWNSPPYLETSLPSTATKGSRENATWPVYDHNYPSFKQTTLNVHLALT